MNEQDLHISNFKEFEIAALSLIVVIFCVFIVSQKHTANVGVYIDGDKGDTVKVVDLSLNYGSNLNLVSYSHQGLLKVWRGKRFLLMPDLTGSNKKLIQLRFESATPFTLKDITIMPQSQVYISNIGPVYLPNEGISFKLNYSE